MVMALNPNPGLERGLSSLLSGSILGWNEQFPSRSGPVHDPHAGRTIGCAVDQREQVRRQVGTDADRSWRRGVPRPPRGGRNYLSAALADIGVGLSAY